MSLNLDIVIDTPEESVDMKAGLETLQGASDTIRIIGETILSNKVPERLSHKGKVRTTLKKSFSGSYGHTFSLDIFDEKLKRKFNLIGRETFSELISYFISESLYLEGNPLTDKAQKIVDTLEENADELVKQLRTSALKGIHDISTKFNHDVRLRFRKNAREQILITKFDQSSAEVLQAKETFEEFDIIASITRLNINTGNGRLQLKEADETVAFGFGAGYKTVKFEVKRLFSGNLNHNNGIDRDNWEFLRIAVTPIKMTDGRIVKYIVKRFYDGK